MRFVQGLASRVINFRKCTALYDAEALTLETADRKYLDIFKMWC